MIEFKILSKEEIAKLNNTDKAIYLENLAKYEAEQVKVKANADVDAEKKEKVTPGKYLNDSEIKELKKHNPTIKQFYVTSDKVAFPQLWLAIDHEKNIKGNPDMIQEVK